MTLRFQHNVPVLIAEVARLADAPSVGTIQRLESALRDAFNFSQAIVRVDTGSLRNSGVTESAVAGDQWVGTLTYGGPSPGAANDPVHYATIVQAYDAPDDWLTATAQRMEPLFLGAVRLQFR